MSTERRRRKQPSSALARRRARSGPFVYGIIHGALFVVPRKVAVERARLNRALHTCRTWGEVTAQAPRNLCRDIRETLGTSRIPADREVGDILEELVDHYYPPSLGRVMLWHLPEELNALVRREESMLGEELPSLSEEAVPRVRAVFAAKGIPCTEDQALIVLAAGYDTDAPEEVRA